MRVKCVCELVECLISIWLYGKATRVDLDRSSQDTDGGLRVLHVAGGRDRVRTYALLVTYEGPLTAHPPCYNNYVAAPGLHVALL